MKDFHTCYFCKVDAPGLLPHTPHPDREGHKGEQVPVCAKCEPMVQALARLTEKPGAAEEEAAEEETLKDKVVGFFRAGAEIPEEETWLADLLEENEGPPADE